MAVFAHSLLPISHSFVSGFIELFSNNVIILVCSMNIVPSSILCTLICTKIGRHAAPLCELNRFSSISIFKFVFIYK